MGKWRGRIIMKIGILTINEYNNYGNRLQNYASQEVLKSLGFSVKTVVNNTKHAPNNGQRGEMIKKIRNLNGMTINEIYEKIKFKLWNYVYKNKIQECKNKRIEAFKKFTSINIEETDYSICGNNIPRDLEEKLDYFVTGSDQVWNPMYRYGSPIDFLTFAPEGKKIAYAPSFGISEIPLKYVEKYSVWLSKMSRLSVREEAGAEIIKELTGRDAIVLVDPTLMLSKEKWLSISKQASNKPKSQYLLTYFLGNVTKENREKIEQISIKKKLQIVNLADIKDRERYISDPSEFIDYVNSASAFFTDSFHGAVFSILLQTPFAIYDRIGNIPSMNSRMDTLLSTFNLNSRKMKNIININDIFNVDYSHVAPILEVERKKALDYLKEALQVKDSSIKS